MIDLTTFLLIIALFVLLFILMMVVRRLNQQEKTITQLYTTITTSFNLMSEIAQSNKKLASCLKETMLEVEGHTKLFESLCRKSKEDSSTT